MGTVIGALVATVIAGSVLLSACYSRPALVMALLIFSTLLQEVLFVNLEKVATLNQAIGFALVWVSAIKALNNGDLFRKIAHPITFALVICLGNMTVSYLLLSVGHDNPLQDIRQFFHAFAWFLLCLLVIRKERDLIFLAGAYVVGGIVVAISGYFWHALVNPLQYITTGRQGIHGVAGHYIEYAFRCIIPLPIILSLLTAKKFRILNPGLIAAGIALSTAALLSGSRGAVVSFFFMSMIVVLLSRGSSFRKKIIMGVALMAIPFVLPIDGILGNLFSIIQGDFPSDYSTMSRLSYINIVFQNLSIETLLWGTGLENFRDYYSGNLNPPHSIWLQTFFELGTLGLVTQLFIIHQLMKLFMSVYRRRAKVNPETSAKLTLGIGLSVFVILFWGFYENIGWLNGSKHLFILTGSMIAGSRIVGFEEKNS